MHVQTCSSGNSALSTGIQHYACSVTQTDNLGVGADVRSSHNNCIKSICCSVNATVFTMDFFNTGDVQQSQQQVVGFNVQQQFPVGFQQQSAQTLGEQPLFAIQQPLMENAASPLKENNLIEVGREIDAQLQPRQQQLGVQLSQQQPQGVQQTAQQPLGIQQSAHQPLGIQLLSQQPLGVQQPEQQPLGVQQSAHQPLGIHLLSQQPLGVQQPEQQPLGVQQPAHQPLGVQPSSQHPLGVLQQVPFAVQQPLLDNAAAPWDFDVKKDNNLYELGRDIKAEPTIYEGILRVDIRHWKKDGTRSTKGISLPAQCWYAVVNGCYHIQNALNEMKAKQPVDACFHVGNLVYVSIKSPLWLVDIRYWYKAEDGTLKPSRRGISLKFKEFNKLMEHADDIRKRLEAIPHKDHI